LPTPVAEPTELSKLKLPKIAELGEANPVADTLRSFQNFTFLGLGDQSARPADSQIFTTAQLGGSQQAMVHAVSTLIDKNRDGKITTGEYAEFAYRADRLGDRDGKTSVAEYNVLLAAGHSQYLVSEAKAAGLDANTQAVLEGRLAIGALGISGPHGLLDALDVSQTSRDIYTGARKAVAFANAYESALASVPREQRDDLRRLLLQHAAETGTVLVPIGMSESRHPIFASDSLQTSVNAEGVASYRYQTKELEFIPAAAGKPGTLKLVREESQEHPTEIVSPDRYKYSSTESNPFLTARGQTLITTLLADRDFKKNVDKFLQAGVETLRDPNLLQAALEPIHTSLQKALGNDPRVGFSVKKQAESGDEYGVYLHPSPEAHLAPNLELYLAPRLQNLIDTARSSIRQGGNEAQTIAEGFRELRHELLGTLFEENFHSMQHQQIDRFEKNPASFPAEQRERLKDYSLNRRHLVSPVDLNAFFGDSSLYSAQPIEADAKRFRADLLKALTK